MERLPVWTCLLLLLLHATSACAERDRFPTPDYLKPAFGFWIRVYTEVDSNAGYIHDSRNLGIVYETLRFKPYSNSKQQNKTIKAAVRRYREALKRLASGKRKGLSDDEKKVLGLWGASVSGKTLNRAAKELRFQRGQADRVRDGVIRSGAWEEEMLETLRSAGLPPSLAIIPHIESSYNPKVRSPAGALGLWQFTRATGAKYLQIDHVVDERLDPLKSTAAAAALLKHNYKVLGNWPLAITAYNTGLTRILRAVRDTGTKDIGVIVRDYRGRRFGFASRNFYAAFLAMVDITENIESYFGVLHRDSPEKVRTVDVPGYLEAKALEEELAVTQGQLKRLNPALQYSVWSGSKYVPKGYKLNLPFKESDGDLSTRLKRLAQTKGHERQIPDTYYRVRHGDTLSAIALRYSISVRELVELNNLRSRHRIRVGQSLRLPQG